MATLTYTETLEITSCWCGAPLAIERNALKNVRANKGKLWCPTMGHEMWFSGPTAAEQKAKKLEEELETERRRSAARLAAVDRARAEAEHQRNVANGYKGALAKTKKRAAKGVCPVPGCKRHFVNVERHVASQHPDYVAPEATS